MSESASCLFCSIAKGDIPAHVVWENNTHMAFLTLWPNTEGFTVVIPKAHAPSYVFEANSEVMHATIDAAKEVALILDAYFEDVGRTGLIFEGFGVDHLHAKLVPMHGTGNMDEWRAINSETMKEYFDQYPGYISSHDSKQVDDATLKILAEKIRQTKES